MNWVFKAGNGEIKKVPKCNVKLDVKASNKIIDLEEEKEGQVKANGPCPTDLEDNNENKDKNEVTFEDSVKKEGMITRSMKMIQEIEDDIPTYWMKVEKHENFENYAVYTVEIPTKEQNTR